jgi:hypothetical protein
MHIRPVPNWRASFCSSRLAFAGYLSAVNEVILNYNMMLIRLLDVMIF